MKHTVQLKMPKIFGRKKVENGTNEGPEVRTEVELDVIKTANAVKLMAGTLAVGLTVGYIAGLNKGVSKTPNIVVVK